jgi:hypothetical protein
MKGQAFFDWAYKTRAKTVTAIKNGEQMSPEKMFLSFTCHEPTFISHGPAGLNGSVKGVGFVPKKEYMEEAYNDYKKHIDTYKEGDKEYSDRGLEVLIKHLYSEQAEKRVDFSVLSSVEMAFKHSYENYQANPECTLMFFQPPVISYEIRGKIELHMGDLYHKLVNAQHDCYHLPNVGRWEKRPAYIVRIEEIFDNSATQKGFGVRLD